MNDSITIANPTYEAVQNKNQNMTKFLLIWLLTLPFSVYATTTPCLGNGGINDCRGDKFICNDGSFSKSTKNCPKYIQSTSSSKTSNLSPEQTTIERVMAFTKSYSSIFSGLLGGLVSSALTFFLYQKTALKHARLASLSSVVPVERSVADAKAFCFHGITDKAIREAGITEQQLAYLVANFTAGRIHDTGAYNAKKPFGKSNYRYKMLEQSKTQDAWELILQMMTEDDYIKKLQRTMDKIKVEQKKRVGT